MAHSILSEPNPLATCQLPLATCHQHSALCTLRYLISSFTDLIFFQIYRSSQLYPFLIPPLSSRRVHLSPLLPLPVPTSQSLSLSVCLVLDVLSLDWFGLLWFALLWFAAWLLLLLLLLFSVAVAVDPGAHCQPMN